MNKPTATQRSAIIAALENGGRTSSDPYQLRTIATLVAEGWMVEPDGQTLEVTDAGREAVGASMCGDCGRFVKNQRGTGYPVRHKCEPTPWFVERMRAVAQERRWVADVKTALDNGAGSIRKAETAVRDAAHVEALVEAADRHSSDYWETATRGAARVPAFTDPTTAKETAMGAPCDAGHVTLSVDQAHAEALEPDAVTSAKELARCGICWQEMTRDELTDHTHEMDGKWDPR